MLKTLFTFSLGFAASLPLVAGCRSTGMSDVKEDGGQAAVAGVPESGRYVGYTKPEAQPTAIATDVDLTRVYEGANTISYRAVIKLMPGGFGSHEYAGLYFQDVSFDKAKKQLTFAGGPDGVTLSAVEFIGTKLKARIQSTRDQGNAWLEVQPEEGEAPATPANLEHHITGNYVGSCPDQVVSMQIEASKWRGLKGADTSLFGGYRLNGRLGQADDVTCGIKQTCVKESYFGGELHILAGSLSFKTAKGSRTCGLKGDTISCDGCSLVKDPISPHAVLDLQRDFKVHPRKEHLKAAKVVAAESADSAPKKTPKLGGQYYGYLHHANSNVYQLVALNVKAEPETNPQGKPTGRQHVGAVATLYFGEGDSSEFIAYRFAEEMWPENNGKFVFDGDGESLFVIDRWNDKTIVGTWHSKVFGEVGTVELQRDMVPGLGSDAETMEKLSGLYKGEEWDFELGVSANISEDRSDFFPLKIYGWAREKIDNSRRRSIEEGTYDFYSGAFAFRLDDGRIVAGRVLQTGMQLYWPPKPRLGTPLVTGANQMFKRVADTQTAQQAKAITK